MSGSEPLPRARARTFGVELEFIILWLWDDEPDPYQEWANELPPILRIPRESSIPLPKSHVDGMVYDAICDVLNRHGIPARRDPPRASEFRVWNAKSDSSIYLTDEKARWTAVELVSPVESASPVAFKVISYVLNLIASTYRIKLNKTCGFHVHVGDGEERMPLEDVKRVASLLWAADPIIATLHPSERRTNRYSQSIRERSPLAQGSKIADVLSNANHREDDTCLLYIGRSMRHGEQPISWRSMNQLQKHIQAFKDNRSKLDFQPFIYDDTERSSTGKMDSPTAYSVSGPNASEIQARTEKATKTINDSEVKRSSHPYSSTLRRLGPRFLLPERLPDDESMSTRLDAKAESDIGVFAGVSEIFSCESSCVISLLLETRQRPNYSFFRYRCNDLMDPPWRAPTIEFREAAGTTSGRWAEVWASICVGLTHFAIHAPVDVYLSVLFHLDEATSGEASYDVVDLLGEVGLFAESVFAEKRLTQYKDEWGLKYDSEGENNSH
ncbi:putative amidoligase enzyme-domain-containing protein [Daldinia caldariorum]|uniref:putative amidoligase enzyme-domain-containing protein n=1 Tax=Daldinia caldariorum TaxID=326644 RepID=UPI002007998C|nr:putative amidoligase enzyme-domain-containing protein [Daldinia caldariorum]KAI1472706.1 putative amidoligase enzyme-domain-containing protein [Daldinia caldariorum]